MSLSIRPAAEEARDSAAFFFFSALISCSFVYETRASGELIASSVFSPA